MNEKFRVLLICLLYFITIDVDAQSTIIVPTQQGGTGGYKQFTIHDGAVNVTDYIDILPSYGSLAYVVETDQLTLVSNGCSVQHVSSGLVYDLPSEGEGSLMHQYCTTHGGVLREQTKFLTWRKDEGYELLNCDGKEAGQDYFMSTTLYRNSLDIAGELLHTKVVVSGDLSVYDVLPKEAGDGFWLAVGDRSSNLLKIYDIGRSSTTLHSSIKLPQLNYKVPCYGTFKIKFSHDGQQCGVMIGSCYFALYDFDGCSGRLFNARMSVASNSSYWGTDFAFTLNDKYVVINRHHYNIIAGKEVCLNEFNIYKTTSIGVVSKPYQTIPAPYEFSMGEMLFADESNLLIFNRFRDRNYLRLHIPSFDPFELDPTYIRLDGYYYPAVGIPSISQSATICTSATKTVTLGEIAVYPNPTTGSVLASIFDLAATSVLRIYDALGVEIATVRVHGSREIDMSQLTSGVYFFNFYTDKNLLIHTIKVVKL